MDDYDIFPIPFENFTIYEDDFEDPIFSKPAIETVFYVSETLIGLTLYIVAASDHYPKISEEWNSKLFFVYLILACVPHVLIFMIQIFEYFGFFNSFFFHSIIACFIMDKIFHGFTLALGLDCLLKTYKGVSVGVRKMTFTIYIMTRIIVGFMENYLHYQYHTAINKIDLFFTFTLNLSIFINLFGRIHDVPRHLRNVGYEKSILFFLLSQLSYYYIITHHDAYSGFGTPFYAVVLPYVLNPLVYILLVKYPSQCMSLTLFHWLKVDNNDKETPRQSIEQLP